MVPHAEPRLITSRTVIRSLLNSNSTTSIQDAADRVGPIALLGTKSRSVASANESA